MQSAFNSLSEIKELTESWKNKIRELECNAGQSQGPAKVKQLELVEEMKQKESILQNYVEFLESAENEYCEEGIAKLSHMMKDIEASYRRALSYIFL